MRIDALHVGLLVREQMGPFDGTNEGEKGLTQRAQRKRAEFAESFATTVLRSIWIEFPTLPRWANVWLAAGAGCCSLRIDAISGRLLTQ